MVLKKEKVERVGKEEETFSCVNFSCDPQAVTFVLVFY